MSCLLWKYTGSWDGSLTGQKVARWVEAMYATMEGGAERAGRPRSETPTVPDGEIKEERWLRVNG